MSASLCTAVALAMAAAPPAEASVPRILDMVVARVDDEIITLSELTAETRLVLLDARGPGLAMRAELTERLLAAVLRAMMHRALLEAEMRRLQLRAAPDAEVERAVQRLRRPFSEPGQLRDFLVAVGWADPDTPDAPGYGVPVPLVGRIRTEVEVERFLDVRVRANLVISPSEVRACYEANRARFEGMGFERAEPRIRVRLREQKESAALDRLLEQLEAQATVRVEPPFAGLVDEVAPPEELGFTCPLR